MKIAIGADHGGFQMKEMVKSFICSLGHEVEDDLAIDGGLENGALGLELVAQHGGIGEVAIVGDGDLAPGAIHR